MSVGRRWTIRRLLLGVNLFILLVPIAAVVLPKVLQAYLLRQTERQLISQAVIVGEAWRDRLLVERGDAGERPPSFKPPGRGDDAYVPFRALLDLNYEVVPENDDPPRPDDRTLDARQASPAWRAGQAIEPMLARAQAFNLSGARVLDRRGCVIASTGADRQTCLDHLREVAGALGGSYSAIVRRKGSYGYSLPLTSLQRRSDLRVFIAIPIFLDDEVVGAVRMSRASVSSIEMLWAHRGKVALVGAVVLLFTPLLSYLFFHAISKPVRGLTRAAEEMAAGAPRRPFTPGAMAPREVLILSNALNRMTAQLTEKSEYIVQFASNVSHELKTPITGISGAIELLRDDWKEMSEEQRRRFLRNISADASRLERLAAGLLQLARVESVREAEEPVELEPFVRKLVQQYGEAVRVDFSDDDLKLSVNPAQLEMALHNLIDNAVRHGRNRPVEVEISSQGGRCVFAVTDHGEGIPEANRARIFDRFFTTERGGGGTGLGLPIVKAPGGQPADDLYILVTAHVQDVESPTGTNGGGTEIDRSQSICQ